MDRPKKQSRLRSPPFGKIPAAVVDAGCLRGLTQAEALTYIMLCRHCDGEDWASWPSVALIASNTGVTRRPIQAALRSLEERGLVSLQERGGGRSRSAVYRINSAPPGAVSPSNSAPPSAVSPSNSALGSAVSQAERALLDDLKGAAGRPKRRCGQRPNRVNRENRGAACAARRLEGRRLGREVEKIRAETAALDVPDADWINGEVARHGVGGDP